MFRTATTALVTAAALALGTGTAAAKPVVKTVAKAERIAGAAAAEQATWYVENYFGEATPAFRVVHLDARWYDQRTVVVPVAVEVTGLAALGYSADAYTYELGKLRVKRSGRVLGVHKVTAAKEALLHDARPIVR